jgi:general transcription factor 3C polypeptide 3 (transcription factor C subunit 4)
MHANIVLSQDLLDYSPLFVEIADAYFDREMYAEASPLYELLGEDATVSFYCPSTRILEVELEYWWSF